MAKSKPLKEKQITEQDRMFVREYFRTGYASEAFRLTHNTENMSPGALFSAAHRLKYSPRVLDLIFRKRRQRDNDHIETMKSLVEWHYQNRQDAINQGDREGAVAATLEIARIHGFVPKRYESGEIYGFEKEFDGQ